MRRDRREYLKNWRKAHPDYYTNEEWKEYNRKRAKKRHWKWKLFLMEKLGKKCNRCPETHPACLVFHHLKPEEKETKKEWIRKSFINKVENGVIELLCANCHRKEHNKELLKYLEDVAGIEPT